MRTRSKCFIVPIASRGWGDPRRRSPCERLAGAALLQRVVSALIFVHVMAATLVAAPTAFAQAAPSLIGTYNEHTVCTSCGGSTYAWTFQITTEDQSTGSFSGTATYSDGQTTASLAGTVSGSTVSVTVTQQNGYVSHHTGTLASNCSVSGTWTQSDGGSGTWTMTPQSGQCGSPPPGVHRYYVELKAWIPFGHVVDPEMPFEPTSYLLNRDLFGEPVCHETSFFAQYLTNLISVFRGDGHTGYAGSYRVLSTATFDWDGTHITNFRQGPGPHFGTTHRDINQNGPDGEFSCSATGMATHTVAVQQTGPASFSLLMAAKDPLVIPSLAPDIDSTLTGSFGSDGSLKLSWQSDLFPSHGFYVAEDGNAALTAVTNNPASCMTESDARGPLGAQRLAFGLTHPDNTGYTVLPANALGLSLNRGSLLCSEDFLDTALPTTPPSSSADTAAAPGRAARSSVTVSRIVNGHQSSPISLTQAASRGWLTLLPMPGSQETNVLSDPRTPIALHIRRMPFIVRSVGAGVVGNAKIYLPNRSVTLTLSKTVLVRTAKGRRLAPAKIKLSAASIKTRIVRHRGKATITFVIKSSVPIKALYVSVGGKRFHVLHGRTLRVPNKKLRAVAYYAVNTLGIESHIKTL